MAVQFHRRDAFLVLCHEVDSLKPHRQGQFCGVEDGACGDGGLVVAAIALLELVGVELAASVVATVFGQHRSRWAIAIDTGRRSTGLRFHRARGIHSG